MCCWCIYVGSVWTLPNESFHQLVVCGTYTELENVWKSVSIAKINICFFLKRPLETYMYFAFNVISLICVNNGLSIYCGHLQHDNTHTELQLQWNNFIQIMQSWMTLQIPPSWASYGCLSWDLQRNMTVIYQECTVVPIDMGNLYSKTFPNIRSVTYNISHEIWSYFLCSVSSIYTMKSQWMLWFLYP